MDVIILVHVLEFIPSPRRCYCAKFIRLCAGRAIDYCQSESLESLGTQAWWTSEHDLPWNGHFWPLPRVKHWLRDLGLRIVMSDTFCFRPPLHSLRSWQRLLWLEALGPLFFPALGGFYILAAQKRAHGMTPIIQSDWEKIDLRKSMEPTIRTLTKYDHDTDH